jgi:hypothetical protein
MLIVFYTHPNLLIVSLILAQDSMQKSLTWRRLQNFSAMGYAQTSNLKTAC